MIAAFDFLTSDGQPTNNVSSTRTNNWEPPGAAARRPAAYGLSPPLFQPLTAYAARGRIFPAPARGNPAPQGRAISVPLDSVTSGSPRLLPGTSPGRSGPIEARIVQLPKLTVRVRFPSPAPSVRARPWFRPGSRDRLLHGPRAMSTTSGHRWPVRARMPFHGAPADYR
jgi:hypothetical protein